MRRRALGGAAAFVASASLTVVGIAQATPTWLSSTPLSPAGSSAEAPQVSANARGDAVAEWVRNGVVEVSGRAAGAAGWGSAQKVSSAGSNAQAPLIGIDAAGDAVAAWRSVAGGEEFIEVSARTGLSGAWSTPVVVEELGPEELGQSDPDLALASSGAATIVWARKGVLWGASRAPGGSFGAPEKVTEEEIDTSGPRVATDAPGDATVVFELKTGGERVIGSSTRPSGAGGKWSAPMPVSDPLAVNVPSVAVNARGDAVAVWEAFFEELGAGSMEEHIQVATRPAGASTWGTPVTLTKTKAGLGEPGNQEVAIDGQGDAVATWARMHGAKAETVETSQDHVLSPTWSGPLAVSGPGNMEEAPQIGVDEAGHAMIVWERQEPGGSTEIVEASEGSATAGTWHPAEAASATATGSEAKEPDVALDGEGDAVGVWGALHSAVLLAEAAGFDAAGPAVGALSIPVSGTVGQSLAFSLSAADVWSPLGATTWFFGDGQSASGTSVAHAYAKAGSYDVTVITADVLGNATSVTAALRIASPASRGGPPLLPHLTGAHLTHTRFRVSKRATAISAAAHGKPPLGTIFQFTLSEAAAVQIVFTHPAKGLRSGRTCAAPTPKLRRRHARTCTRIVTVGRLRRAHEGKGRDGIAFSGRLGARALPPRSYAATLTATANGRSSAPAKLALTIVR